MTREGTRSVISVIRQATDGSIVRKRKEGRDAFAVAQRVINFHDARRGAKEPTPDGIHRDHRKTMIC